MEMEEFVGDVKDAYAILSHTWGEEEVSLHQYSTPKARSMAGYRKIKHSCALALRSRLPYLWVDTCCIDKSSSAELSEAINSMYKWYRDAAICYVYLSDMERCHEDQSEDGLDQSEDGLDLSKCFGKLRKCRWFTRGWTLQELLAPQHVEFYDQDWKSIGTKETMWDLLSRITGVEPVHLWKSQKASVAQKMSWAANRQTTRTEDIAYSLLGLFNVNMPLLYGEGEKAFRRLQHEILQSTCDESIFAWTDDRVWTSGLLAESPANFAESGDVVPFNLFYRKPYTMTNQGLQIDLRYSDSENEEVGRFETPLRCTEQSIWGQFVIGLHMTYYTDDTGASRALRTGPSQIDMMRNEILSGMKKSYSFHIDDFRRAKLPFHRAIPLCSNLSDVVSPFDSLMRLSGGLHAEDVYVSESRSTNTRNGSFCIVDRTRGLLAGQTIPILPVMYVYWSLDDDPAYLTFDSQPFDPSSFDSNQNPFIANKRPLGRLKLQAGNTLATWFSAHKILFIALSQSRTLEKYIDIQLDNIDSVEEGLLQLTKANPFSTHRPYPREGLLRAFPQSKPPWKESSGNSMYGQNYLPLVIQALEIH